MLNSTYRRNQKIFIFYILFIYIIFFPTYAGGLSLHQGQKILYLSFPIILTLIFFIFKKSVLYFNKIIIFTFIIFLINLFGIFTKFQLIVSFGNYIDYFRYLIYFFIIFISYNLAISMKISILSVKKMIFNLYYFSLIFLLLQIITYSNGIVQVINPRPLINYKGLQIGGPFVWSYSFGFFLILVFFLYMGELFFKKHSVYNFIHLFIVTFLLIFTQSKAIYLTLLFLFFFFLFHSLFIFRMNLIKKLKYLSLSFTLLIIFIFIFIFNIDSFGNILRFIEGFNSGNADASTATRLKQLSYIFNIPDMKLLFGFPEFKITIENAYGYYLYSFGIVGLFMYIILLISINYQNYLIMRNSFIGKNTDLKILTLGFFCFSMSILFLSLGSAIIDGHKTGYLFWTIMGLYYGVIYNGKNKLQKRFNDY